MDYSERKEVAFATDAASILTALAGLPFFWWGYSQDSLSLKALGYANGVGMMGLSAYIHGISTRLQRRNTAQSDFYDQAVMQQQWIEVNNPQLLPPAEGLKEESSIPEGFPMLSWSDFVSGYINKPELYPHFGVFAPTGFGKTLTAEVIGDLRAAHYRTLGLLPRRVYVCPTLNTKQNEFLGWEIQGTGFKKAELENFIKFLKLDLIHRYDLDAEESPPLIVTLDEFRWQAQKLPDVPEAVMDSLSLGRRERQNLILVAQGNAVRTLKMEGEGQQREQMVTILKGGLLVERVAACEGTGVGFPPGSTNYVKELVRKDPYKGCLINDMLLLLPDLSLYRKSKVDKGIGYQDPLPVLMAAEPAVTPATFSKIKKGK